eukprot:5712540-Amphidinium_carterae.1
MATNLGEHFLAASVDLRLLMRYGVDNVVAREKGANMLRLSFRQDACDVLGQCGFVACDKSMLVIGTVPAKL